MAPMCIKGSGHLPARRRWLVRYEDSWPCDTSRSASVRCRSSVAATPSAKQILRYIFQRVNIMMNILTARHERHNSAMLRSNATWKGNKKTTCRNRLIQHSLYTRDADIYVSKCSWNWSLHTDHSLTKSRPQGLQIRTLNRNSVK